MPGPVMPSSASSPPPGLCEAFLEAIGEGAVVVDGDGCIRHHNRSFTKLAGAAGTSLNGRRFAEVVLPGGRGQFIPRSVTLAEDIQRRKDTEAALHDRERKLQAFVQSSPAVICMREIHGRYVLADPDFERVLAKPAIDVRGHTDEDLFPAAVAEARRQLEQHGPGPRRIRGRTHAGRRRAHVVGIPVPRARRDGLSRLLLCHRPRHHRTQTDGAGAARDRAALPYARRGPGGRLDAEARGCIGQIIAGGRHKGELIDGLVQVSRSTRGDLRRDTVDITAMAGSILDELARDERQRRVRVTVATGLEARADARMVEVVLRNLLSNAWKCTSRSAEPEIRVEPAVIEGQPGFRVADTGAGLDMTHAGKLFQPFERMHRQDEFPGIGIGLATAQRIIHRRGSCMRATAAPGFAETAARRGGYWLATNEPPPP